MKPMRTPAIVHCTADKCDKTSVCPDCVYCGQAKIQFVDLEGKILSEIKVLAAIEDISLDEKPKKSKKKK